jgi:hypothetical protein
MTAKPVKLLLAVVVTAGLVGALWWREHTAAQRLQTELSAAKAQLSELEKLRAELDRLAAENQRLRAEAVDPSELARLRALANDVRRLQQEKATLEKKLAPPSRPTAAAPAAPAMEPKPETPPAELPVLATGSAAIGAGQSLVSGGWTFPDGRTGLTMITPKVVTQPDGTSVIELDAKIIAVSPSALESSGLSGLISPNQDAAKAGSSLTPTSDFTLALRQLNSAGQVEVMGAPRVTTSLGGQAEISVGNGQGNIFTMQFYPTAGANGALNLDFNLKGSDGTLAR